MTIKFLSWRRSDIVSRSQEQAGRLGRQLTLVLDDIGDAAPARQNQARVLFPAASDVVALKPGAIRHLAPKPNTPDAETTKFVHVDFTEPDLPWRYTPKPSLPGQGGLAPWMVLLVGTNDDLQTGGGFVTKVTEDVLKTHRLDHSHRWAHVQNEDGVMISRLLSPQRLVALRDHVAAIVPAFTAAGEPMWSSDGQRNFDVLPALFSWTFQAGEEGDFETLATALRLRSASGLGVATLNYRRPVANVDVSLTLGGAITSLASHPDQPDEVRAAREDLDVLNNRLKDTAPGDDPSAELREIMQLPDYGGLWCENTSAVQWAKSMNDDPRHRGVAGLGLWMGVVEQEALMDAAVKQAGALQDVSQRVSHLAAGLDAAKRLWRRRRPESAELQLRVCGPAMGRMLAEGGGTVLDRVTSADSTLDSALFSSAAQRLLRNGTARARFAGGRIDRTAFLKAANRAPARIAKTPAGLPHVDGVAEGFGERPLEEALGLPEMDRRLEDILRKFAGRPVDLEHVRAFNEALKDAFDRDCSELITFFDDFLPLEGEPARVVFDREMMLEGFAQCLGGALPEGMSSEGLESALPWPEEPDRRRPIDVSRLAEAVNILIDPTQPQPPALSRVGSTITGVDITTLAPPEAPIGLDFPTWTLLNRHEREWLLPGATTIPSNSIVSLQTNPSFVDAFMVGINTQFLSEMRWRNLPAPRVSTPLRMFWGYVNHETDSRDPDIKPIGDWPARPFGAPDADDVGDLSHQHVEAGDATGRQDLVIAFRTALFRRYPSTLVYLVHPLPGDDLDTLLKATPDFAEPPGGRWQRRYLGPIFFGQMEPDLVFFAFDIPPSKLDEYWLVLDEPPSELRFRNDKGMDWSTSAQFANETIDEPTRVAIDGAELEAQALQP